MEAIVIWEDLHNERAGYFRAFAINDLSAYLAHIVGDGSNYAAPPVIGYCSSGGSHRTIRATVRELRRLGHREDVYRNGRIIDRCPMARPAKLGDRLIGSIDLEILAARNDRIRAACGGPGERYFQASDNYLRHLNT